MNPRICARTCSVAWCIKTTAESTLFSFPSDASRVKQWEKALVYKTNVKSTKRKICTDHFEDVCFSSTSRAYLLPSAIPTRQIKIKEEKITKDEASKSQFSWNNLRTSSKESTNILSEIHANNEAGNKSLSAYSEFNEKVETSKRKRIEEIEKTLEEYLQKRHLVYGKLKELDKELDEDIEKPSTKKIKYEFPNNLSMHKAVHSFTASKVGGDFQNVKSNSTCNTFIESNEPKNNNVAISEILKELDLKLMSSIDKSTKNHMSETVNKKLEKHSSKTAKKKVEKHSSNTAKKKVEKHSSKTAKKMVEKISSKTAKKEVQKHPSKTSRLRTENCTFKTVKEGVENCISQAPESGKIESEGGCIFEIGGDFNSFAKNIAERLKRLKNPFARVKALMGIQQVLLEAECSTADGK